MSVIAYILGGIYFHLDTRSIMIIEGPEAAYELPAQNGKWCFVGIMTHGAIDILRGKRYVV